MNAAVRILKIAAVLVSVGWIAPAFADVALTTAVQKMERMTAADGTVT